jgi:branched-chain amino acid transport system substrate-binding protein
MATPLRVGILNDLSSGPPALTDIGYWLRLCVEEVAKQGRIDRAIEFVNAFGLGFPSGSAAAVEEAYASLVDQDVVLIVGPAIGDNALVATPLTERARVPTINWAGSERARGDYMFHLQVGSHEDESIVLARHLATLGVQRIGVVFDQSPIGQRHLLFLQSEAKILGLEIAATSSIAPLAESAKHEVHELLDARADAIVYLGLGLSAKPLAQELNRHGWSGPRLMNTAGLRGYAPDFARAIDGWIYVDMHSDSNTTLRALRERCAVPPAKSLAAAKGFDLGRLVAEGIARASEHTRDGIKVGLEQVKWLPAAEGYDGTLLSFGAYDRGALHGRYLVLRRWQDGNTIEV